jgi:transcriptional accessory protein Tex/SPT6
VFSIDLAKLKEFIKEIKPHVIAIGAGIGETDVYRFYEEIRRLVDTGERRVHVTWVDAQVPRIYKNSKRAGADFPDYPPFLR